MDAGAPAGYLNEHLAGAEGARIVSRLRDDGEDDLVRFMERITSVGSFGSVPTSSTGSPRTASSRNTPRWRW